MGGSEGGGTRSHNHRNTRLLTSVRSRAILMQSMYMSRVCPAPGMEAQPLLGYLSRVEPRVIPIRRSLDGRAEWWWVESGIRCPERQRRRKKDRMAYPIPRSHGRDTDKGSAASPETPAAAALRTLDAGTDVRQTPLLSLPAIWEAHDRASGMLAGPNVDQAIMDAIEQVVSALVSDLEGTLRLYLSTHGTHTPEGRVALTSLGVAQQDVRWLRLQHDTATGVELRDRLRHALRCSVNGLALLRWSMVM